MAAQARERARRSRRPHNLARPIFAREIITALTRQLAANLGRNVLGGGNLMGQQDIDELRAELRDDPAVQRGHRRAVAGAHAAAARRWSCWPTRPGSRRPRRGLTTADRGLLQRDADADWTPADVPLLDEAAELLGEDERAARAERDRRRRLQEAYAQGVLDIIGRDDEDDPELLMGADIIDASRLAERFEDEESLTAAERAAADRTWAFGHVIVDEAQELSPMAWRMLMRRCPGQLADDRRGPRPDRRPVRPRVVGRRARAVPGGPLAAGAADRQLPDPVGGNGGGRRRAGRDRPPAGAAQVGARFRAPAVAAGRVPDDSLAESVAAAAVRLAEQAGDGKLAVIVPADRLDELGKAVGSVLPGTALGADPDLTSPVVVLTVRQVKGLEFDCVLIADPAQILAESPRGLNDLYVALTRATQRVGVVHAGSVPAGAGPAGARVVRRSGGLTRLGQWPSSATRPTGQPGAQGRAPWKPLVDRARAISAATWHGMLGDVEPAVAQREDAARRGRVVAADVVPAFVDRVGSAAVQFNDGQVLVVEPVPVGAPAGLARSGPGGLPPGRPCGRSTSRVVAVLPGPSACRRRPG